MYDCFKSKKKNMYGGERQLYMLKVCKEEFDWGATCYFSSPTWDLRIVSARKGRIYENNMKINGCKRLERE